MCTSFEYTASLGQSQSEKQNSWKSKIAQAVMSLVLQRTFPLKHANLRIFDSTSSLVSVAFKVKVKGGCT